MSFSETGFRVKLHGLLMSFGRQYVHAKGSRVPVCSLFTKRITSFRHVLECQCVSEYVNEAHPGSRPLGLVRVLASRA
jgi:hypothetical protein